ncbi:SPFH domain-containing protein [Paenibacillus sp. IB182496]|uniref:SPFH domain-containing protein n=1 Tax=Paenibacillus sabuli TaxID=2772509 RepID=A0A927GU68_9BACL|nr:SPFH domain-containing protein [Paenibacillus sabuli]MBD2848041.1 SPFH domain-containing protein [Paenibacillus sabuli]
MFGIKFVKFQPSEYVMKMRSGRVVREGVGLSFFYYAPVTSAIVIPVSSVDAPFMFEEVTRDFQSVTVQGQLTYRIADFHQMSRMLDYTYNLRKKAYLSDDPGKLGQRVIGLAKVLVKRHLEAMPLREAIQAGDRLAAALGEALADSPELKKLGLEAIGASILAVLPSKETMRALEAQTREQILREADEALYERRNASIEQERIVRENELGTEIAIEAKKKQIRESQLAADRLVQQKKNEMQQEQLHFDTAYEEERETMLRRSADNRRVEADARAYELSAVMGALGGADQQVLQALTRSGMNPNQLIAAAFEELAGQADKIGQLNISPDLLQGLLQGEAAQVTERRKR